MVFPSHQLPLVSLAGLPPDPALHPDLHPRGCSEAHHPDSQEPAPAAVRPAQLRVHLPHPWQHHPSHRPALQQHQHPVPEHLGECPARPGAAFLPCPGTSLARCTAGFALLWAGQGSFWCMWAVRCAPLASPRCMGRLLLEVVPGRSSARDVLGNPPGFRSTSREIGFGKLQKVAWAGANWPKCARALPPPSPCPLLLPLTPSHPTLQAGLS